MICLISCTVSAKSGQKQENNASQAVSNSVEFDDPALLSAVLKGTGVGDSEKNAKLDAVSQLSNAIVVNVESTTILAREEKDGNYSHSLKEDIILRSDTYLKGVSFTKPVKKDGHFETTAYMTKDSIINTINYLLKTMPSDIETLPVEKFDDVLTMIYLSYSLLYSVSDSQLPERKKYIDILGNLKNEIEKLSNYASIYFSAEYATKGKVEIADSSYEINKKIFLKPGTYKFSAKLEGYQGFSGSVTLSKGDKKSVELILIPEKLEKISLRVESPVRMIDDIERALLDYGIVPTHKKELPHQLVIIVNITSMKIDNYEKQTVSVDLHTFKNGEKFKITHYEHKPFFTTQQNREEKIKEEKRKISVAIAKKFLSSTNLKEFFGESK